MRGVKHLILTSDLEILSAVCRRPRNDNANERSPLMSDDIKALIEAHAPTMLQSAKDEAIAVWEPLFAKTGKFAGLTMVEWVRARQSQAPYCLPTAEVASLEVEACGPNPTLAARAALLAKVGATEYAKILDRWRASPSNLKPVTDSKLPDVAARKNNPWSKEGWSLAKQGALVTIDPARAAAIAKGAAARNRILHSTKTRGTT
jgi:hypothetical protein